MPNEEKLMSIWEHLEELRQVLLRALIGLLLGVVVAFFFAKPLITWLALPVGGIERLQAVEVTESIGVYMRVSLLAGLILALPWIFFQLFSFIGQGLTEKERKYLLIAIPFATLLFAGGAAFAYLVMLPSSLKFFQELLQIQTTLRIRSYFDFMTNLVFWIALSFEIPLIVFILSRVGLVNAEILRKGWRIAIVVIAVLAALITPTADPVNMAIFMLPLFALYLLSIGLAALAGKQRQQAAGKEN